MPNINHPIIAQLRTFPSSDNLELIELLIADKKGTHGEDFLQKFQSILRKTPKIGSTAKANFFTYYMLGSFIGLPNTQLINKLNIQSVYVNLIKSAEAGRQILKTIKVAFQLENASQKFLQLFTFTTVKNINYAQHWSSDELKEILANSQMTRSQLESSDSIRQINGKIYHIDNDFNLHLEDIKIGIGKNLKKYNNLMSELQKLLEQNPLPQSEDKTFIEITPFLKEGVLATSLESHFQKLSSYADVKTMNREEQPINNPLNQVTQAVAEAGSDIVRDLAKLYRHWQSKLKLGTDEVCYQAFSYGLLENLFKYRYALDIAVEKILSQGRVDLVFASRLDGLLNKNWNSIPLAIEFKAGKNSPQSGLQQIKQQGYLHFTPRMRTLSSKGVALGVNFNAEFSDPVVTEVLEIQITPINFIKSLIAIGHLALEKNQFSEDLAKKLEESLADVNYSIIRQNGANDNSRYFSRFVLSQAMGYTESSNSLYMVFNPIDSKDNENLSLFFTKNNDVVILNIMGLTTCNYLTDWQLQSSLEIAKPKIAFLKEQGILKEANRYFIATVDVRNSRSTPSLEKDACVKNTLTDPSREDWLTPIDINRTPKAFSYKEIKPIKFIQSDSLAYFEIGKEIINVNKAGLRIINSESDLQAVWQGGLLANGEVQVFTESNHVLGNRADLIISPVDRHKPLKIIELKYTEYQQRVNELHEQGIHQVEKYVENIKSFSDGKQLELIALTYNAQATFAENIFLHNKKLTEIVHTSDSDRGIQSPEYANPDSPLFFPPDASNNLDKENVPDEVEQPAIEEKLSLEKIAGFMSPRSEAGDLESNVESSPEKRTSSASNVGNILGGIAAGFADILVSLGGTAIVSSGSVSGAATTVGSTLSSVMDSIHSNLRHLIRSSGNNEDTGQLVREIEEIIRQQSQLSSNSRSIEKINRLKQKAEQLSQKYKDQGTKVQEKLAQKRQNAERVKVKNKRKRTELAPLRSKREITSLINEINKLFLLCTLKPSWNNTNPSHSTCVEQAELDCYLSIDFQDRAITLVDLSLWDLHNKTVDYLANQDHFSLSLPLLKDCVKKLIFANASDVSYEFIDRQATIFKPDFTTILNSAKTKNNRVPLLAELYQSIVISNCTQIEFSLVYNASYQAEDCIINPVINSINLIKIDPPESTQVMPIHFNSWNLLQQPIEYSGLYNNTLNIRLDENTFETGFFRVELNNYLNHNTNATRFSFSDQRVGNISLIFTEENIEALHQESSVKICNFHLKTSLPETIVNSAKDKTKNIMTWYQNITEIESNIDVLYSEVVSPDGFHSVFGSRFSDHIWIGRQHLLVYGGQAKDCYEVKPGQLTNETFYISNHAEDCIEDYLILPVLLKNIKMGILNESLLLISTQNDFNRRVTLIDYCENAYNQHLNLLTKDKILFTLPNCDAIIQRLRERRKTIAVEVSKELTTDELCAGTTPRNGNEKETVLSREKREIKNQPPLAKSVLTQKIPHRKIHGSFFSLPIDAEVLSTKINEPMSKLPKLEAKHTTQAYPDFFSNYTGTAINNFILVKWLLSLLSKNAVKQINKAERASTSSGKSSHLPENLYWAKKNLHDAIARYGRKIK